MSTSGRADQKAPATWTFWDWMRIPIFPLIWLYSYFWRGQSNENNPSSSEMSTIGRADNKASATWTFRDWIRIPIFPLISLSSYFWRGQSNEKRNTDACSGNEAIQNEELQRQLSSREQEVINLNRDCSQLRTRSEELQRHLRRREQEVITLNRDCSQLQTRNEELQRHLSSREHEVITLNRECSQLRTRLSQISSMQLTEGNPNIADLSDQNRPDKLAEQFSELYDNQWTDCVQVLADKLGKTEEDSIKILLNIVKTSYDICLDGAQNILTTTKDILFAFAGRSDEEPDKALDALIQEILHKLKCHRTKSFKAAPTNIGKEIRVKLMSAIGEPETDACDCFIEECIRTCWLMCIKDPPMYIFCNQEAVFDKIKYMEYTEMGDRVAYVVWPALYLHKDGPLMRKGVAQGEGKKDRKQNQNTNAATSQLPEPDHTQQYHTIIEDTKTVESDHQEKETQAHISEEMASASDGMSETDVISNGDKGNADKLGYENCTQTESITENCSWKQKQKDECFHALPEDEFQSEPKDETTESKEQSYNKLVSSDEYCQTRQISGAFSTNEEENQRKEMLDAFIECNNGQEVKKEINIVHMPLAKNIGDSCNDAEEQERPQLIKVCSSSDDSSKEEKEEKNSQSSTKGEATEIKEQADNKLVSSDEYCQQREPSGASNINEEENQGKETQDGFAECNNGQEVKEPINFIPAPHAKNIGDSPNDAEEEERQQSINVCSSSDNNWKKEKEENCSQSSTKDEAIESKEQAYDKLVSSDEYCQQRETSGAGSINEEENQGKETQDVFIECTKGQELKEGINIIHTSLAKNIGDCSSDDEEEEGPYLINVRSSCDNSWKEEKEEKNSQSSTQCDAVEIKEQADNKLVSSDEYCQQRETLGASNINEEENQGKETQNGLIECNNGQEVKEGISIIPAPHATNIGDSPIDAEEEERQQSINVRSSSDDNWKEGKEKWSQSLTKDEAMERKEQAENKLFSSDEYSQQRETSGAFNINEEESQGKENKDGFIECTIGQEVKEASHIVRVPSDMNIFDSHNDVEQEERLKSTSVCRSSDYGCIEDKEEEDVQSSTKDEATERKEQAEHKLLLPNEYCQERESLGASKINEKEGQTQDWVILCNDGQEVNEAVNVAHESLQENNYDSSNDTEHEKRLKSTNNCSSSDHNKNKDKDNANFHASR